MPKGLFTSILLLITILSFSGCCGPSQYQFTNTQLSDARNEKTYKIIEPKNTFPSDIQTIYGQSSFVMPNDGEMTYIMINFAQIDENGYQEIVDSSTKSTQHAGLLIFEGKRPGFSWPVGQYVVDFIVNDISYAQYPFEIVSSNIVSDTAKSEWGTDYQTSIDIDSEHNPIQPSSNFKTTDEEIFLSFASTPSMPKTTAIRVEWFYLDQKQLIISQEQTMNKSQKTHFTLDKTHSRNFLQSNSDWPTGNYKADIYFDNTLVNIIQFRVK